jgi:DNA polymerase III subunit delta'
MPFRDVTGHRRVIGLLARSIARGRLPQSLIFGGPAGVGKATTALALAQTVNCRTPVRAEGAANGTIEIDACGTCASCRRIARGVHPDIVWIEPGDSGAIKIEPVRAAIEALMYRPFEGARRVVIVDQADALGAAPQNALLKTLEEPTPSSLFVLVTARPDALLPTVTSRCAVLRFARLSASDVASVLIDQHGYAAGEAHAVAALADGSVGQALEARAADFSAARDAAEQVLRAASQAGGARARLDLAKDLLPRKTSGTGTEREYLSVHLRAMASLLRDLAIVGADADRGALANADLASGIERLAASYPHDRADRAFAAVDDALEAIERNVSPKIVADWISLRI